ncbi:MAG: pilus assembly protein [Deltaproteobacteria bacterium]|nr:pilus assembly protein [Deltaproteobacteria bacterium]
MRTPMQDPAEIQTFVERRQTQRAPVTVRIEYGSVDAMFSEFTRNINEGGLFIATEQPLALEEQVQLQFQLPGGDEPVKASGRVVRVQEATADEPSGMGIEFEELDSAARGRINELVLQLRTRG